MDEAYVDVVKWQRAAAEQGDSGWIVNDWGRRMPVDNGNGDRRKSRSFTQSSALLGQSGTREILVDGLLRLAAEDIRYLTMLKAQIHDAVVFEVPTGEVDDTIEKVVAAMSTTWKPQQGGQAVEYTLSYGKPADNWYEASH
jgi:DNA polymerase-1